MARPQKSMSGHLQVSGIRLSPRSCGAQLSNAWNSRTDTSSFSILLGCRLTPVGCPSVLLRSPSGSLWKRGAVRSWTSGSTFGARGGS